MNNKQNSRFLVYLIIAQILVPIAFGVSSALASCENEDSYVDQSLVFAIDISTSIEEDEAELQLRAYETALREQSVQDKLLGCGCTELSVVLFAGESTVVVEPTKIIDEEDIFAVLGFFSDTINTQYTERYLSEYFQLPGDTSVLAGLQTSMDILLQEENTAFRRAILMSGDGVNSTFKERELLAIQEQSEYQGIEISGVPITSRSDLNLCAAYETDHAEAPGVGGACSREPSLSTNGLFSLEQSQSRGQEYGSVTEFYEEFVTNRFGIINTAANFQELAGVLTETIDEFACKPMM